MCSAALALYFTKLVTKSSSTRKKTQDRGLWFCCGKKAAAKKKQPLLFRKVMVCFCTWSFHFCGFTVEDKPENPIETQPHRPCEVIVCFSTKKDLLDKCILKLENWRTGLVLLGIWSSRSQILAIPSSWNFWHFDGWTLNSFLYYIDHPPTSPRE